MSWWPRLGVALQVAEHLLDPRRVTVGRPKPLAANAERAGECFPCGVPPPRQDARLAEALERRDDPREVVLEFLEPARQQPRAGAWSSAATSLGGP